MGEKKLYIRTSQATIDVMRIVNLTPHQLNILDTNKFIHEFPKSENPARVSQKDDIFNYVTQPGSANPIFAVRCTVLGSEIDNLPDYDPDGTVLYVVSRSVAEAAKRIGRPTGDLLITGPSIRDENGKNIGADGFSVIL